MMIDPHFFYCNTVIRLIHRLWPRQIGNQCLMMLVAGAMVGWLMPGVTPALAPIGKIFLQASQIVVMPYLISELVVGFGRLRPGSLNLLAKRGGAVLLATWLVASIMVIVLPQFLPPLITSEFFHNGLFERKVPDDLISTYLPDNIFGALAADNFPAVVLFSCLLGILLQGIDERQQLLGPLSVVRTLFGRVNKLVLKLIPFGIFALIAINIAQLKTDQLIRMQGFLALCLIAFFTLSLLAALVLLLLTPLAPHSLWNLIKGPLALTASSGNLLIALPLLVSTLQEQLPTLLTNSEGPFIDQNAREDMDEELAPLVSLGYALPTLGQVTTLLFIPFAAWYVDRAMEPGATARMLISAIPASVSGIKAVMRQELLNLGLPIDLLQLVYINGEWLYRFEKVLSLEGLIVLAVLVYARGVGAWTPKPLKALGGVALIALLTAGLGFGSRMALARALEGTYRNDQRLLSLNTTIKEQQLVELSAAPQKAEVSLRAIKKRGVLRAGLRSEGLPWSFRNSKGNLVGFDVDLLKKLAAHLGVKLQVIEAPMETLENWLSLSRVDVVAGGIQSTPFRAIRNELSRSYLPVHLALVVHDSKLKELQPNSNSHGDKPITLAVRDESLIGPGLEEQLSRYLSNGSHKRRVVIRTIDSKDAYFSSTGQRDFDGLLTSAESGAAWAVLNPQTSLITPFSNELKGELVLLIGGHDTSLRRFINGWLTREQSQDGIKKLFNYWILLKDG